MQGHGATGAYLQRSFCDRWGTPCAGHKFITGLKEMHVKLIGDSKSGMKMDGLKTTQLVTQHWVKFKLSQAVLGFQFDPA